MSKLKSANCDIFEFKPIVASKRRLSIDFFEQIILKALLLPKSNIQEDFVALSHALYTQLVLWENILSF